MRHLLETLPVHDPILFLPFFARTLRDAGLCSCTVAQSGVGLKWRNMGTRDSLATASTGRLVVTNESALESVTDYTFVIQGLFRNLPALQRIFSKRDAGGTQVEILIANTTQVQMFDGVVASAYDLGNWQPVRTFAIRQQSGEKAEIFINGTFDGLFNVANTITANDANIFVMNLYNGTQPCLADVSSVLWYGSLLSEDQISKTHEYLESRISPRVSPDRQYWDRGSWVQHNRSEDVASWDLGVVTLGESVDRSGNGHVATHNGNNIIWTSLGKAARLNGSVDYIDVADADDLSFGDGVDDFPFSVEAWVKIADATNFPVITKGVLTSTAEFRLLTDPTKKLLFQVFDSSVALTFIGRKYNTALDENKWLHIVATYDASGTSDGIKIYVNGSRVDDLNAQNNPGSYVAIENLGDDVFIGRYSTTYGDGIIKDVRLANRVLSASEIAIRYEVRAATALFHETWQMARPTMVNATASHTMDGTGWVVESGTWKISEDATWKGPECVADGKIVYQGTDDADKWAVKTFEQKAGTPTLNRLYDRLEINGTTGDKVGEILLTVG